MGKSWSLDAKFNLTPTVTVRKVTLLKANKMQLFDSCPVLGTLSAKVMKNRISVFSLRRK